MTACPPHLLCPAEGAPSRSVAAACAVSGVGGDARGGGDALGRDGGVPAGGAHPSRRPGRGGVLQHRGTVRLCRRRGGGQFQRDGGRPCAPGRASADELHLLGLRRERGDAVPPGRATGTPATLYAATRKAQEASAVAGDSLRPVAQFRIVNIGNSESERLLDFVAATETALGQRAMRNYIASCSRALFQPLGRTRGCSYGSSAPGHAPASAGVSPVSSPGTGLITPQRAQRRTGVLSPRSTWGP